jgi:hypothetical protein
MKTVLLETNSDKYLRRLVREMNGIITGGGSVYGIPADGTHKDNAVKIMCVKFNDGFVTAFDIAARQYVIINTEKPIVDHRGQDVCASREN